MFSGFYPMFTCRVAIGEVLNAPLHIFKPEFECYLISQAMSYPLIHMVLPQIYNSSNQCNISGPFGFPFNTRHLIIFSSVQFFDYFSNMCYPCPFFNQKRPLNNLNVFSLFSCCPPQLFPYLLSCKNY